MEFVFFVPDWPSGVYFSSKSKRHSNNAIAQLLQKNRKCRGQMNTQSQCLKTRQILTTISKQDSFFRSLFELLKVTQNLEVH